MAPKEAKVFHISDEKTPQEGETSDPEWLRGRLLADEAITGERFVRVGKDLDALKSDVREIKEKGAVKADLEPLESAIKEVKETVGKLNQLGDDLAFVRSVVPTSREKKALALFGATLIVNMLAKIFHKYTGIELPIVSF